MPWNVHFLEERRASGAIHIHQDSWMQATEMGTSYLKQERNILEGLMGAWRAGLGNGLELRQVGDQ